MLSTKVGASGLSSPPRNSSAAMKTAAEPMMVWMPSL
jgi:hypothetical protein